MTRTTAGSAPASSAWAPLRIRLFRTLWLAALVSNVGTWMPPALLLMFTFVLGAGAILVAPAYQSLVPDMVPREQVPVAAADRRHRLGPLPGRREPARVYRAVQRGELGRAPQAAPERQTGTDLELHDAAAALSDPPPQTDHYLAAAVRE